MIILYLLYYKTIKYLKCLSLATKVMTTYYKPRFLLYEVGSKGERVTLHTSMSYLTSFFKSSNGNGKVRKSIEVIGRNYKNKRIHSEVIGLPSGCFDLEEILRDEQIRLKDLVVFD